MFDEHSNTKCALFGLLFVSICVVKQVKEIIIHFFLI